MQKQIIQSQNQFQPELFKRGIKRALIKFTGGIREPQETLIGPGITTGNVLSNLGLPPKDFSLSKGTGDTTFGINEVIYDKIVDGDLLFVTSRVDAGV